MTQPTYKWPALCFFIIHTFIVSAQDTIALRYSNLISAGTIHKHLLVLASDSLEGRETATTGMVKAARYVSGQYATFGIPAINHNSYLQQIPLSDYSHAQTFFKSGNTTFVNGEDYFVPDAPSTVSLSADEIIFVGYGIADSVSGWNDYANVDVNQKLILILDGEPLNKKGISLITNSGKESVWAGDRWRKIKLARDKKAKGILFVHGDYANAIARNKRRMEHGKMVLDIDENNSLAPVLFITPKCGNKILSSSKVSMESFQKQVSKKQKPASKTIITKSEFTFSSKKASCTNVFGFVEGADLKDEIVVISAHLDHLGKHDNEIYYGADDDGSGSATLLTLAEVFAKARKDGNGPRRSVLFISFTGEEKGLLGSDYYTKFPVFPLDKTVADLNIDMIGRVDTIKRPSVNYTYIIGSDKLSTELHSINETANKICCHLDLDYRYNDPSDPQKLYYRSDHYNFAKHNIPVIFYFTGLHEDYHKPTDTIDKINFEKTAGIAKLVFNTAWELANRPERITIDVKNESK